MPPRKKNVDKKSSTGATPKRKKGKGAKYNKPSTLTFRIDGDLRDSLKKIAEEEYASESSLCNKYIAQGIQLDAFTRAKKMDRRVAALELAQDKEGLQSAQSVVDQVSALADRYGVVESALTALTGILEKIQDRLVAVEEDLELDDEEDTEDDDDEDEDEDEEPEDVAKPSVVGSSGKTAVVLDEDDDDLLDEDDEAAA